MRYLRVIIYFILYCSFIQAVAQTSHKDQVWLPIDYIENIKKEKTLINKDKFCAPIEAFAFRNGKIYFKTYLGRVTMANYKSKGKGIWELTNVESNINRKFNSWTAYKNHTFTLIHQIDTLLLLIKAPETRSSDTIRFTTPISKRNGVSINLVEGYLLLQGKRNLVNTETWGDNREIIFNLDGSITSSIWKSYQILASSLVLENNSLKNWGSFLVQLQDISGNVEKKIMLHYGDKKIEFYRFNLSKENKYILDLNSKMTLISL